MMKLQNLTTKSSILLCWCALIEIPLLSVYIPVTISTQCTSESTQHTQYCVTNRTSFIDIVLNGTQVNRTGMNDTSGGVQGDACSIRPQCDETNGCNTHLHCANFKKLTSYNDSDELIMQESPQALLVTPHKLETIVEKSAVHNVCAIVLFYAPWCAFSVRFARKFNALGRSFGQLPILAVDLAESEPYKYILAYLPMMAFYYNGKTLFKFSLESSFEELKAIITNVTGFEPREGIHLEDSKNLGPVPTVRDTSDRVFLTICLWWVVFIGLVYGIKSPLFRKFYLSCMRTTLRLCRRTNREQV